MTIRLAWSPGCHAWLYARLPEWLCLIIFVLWFREPWFTWAVELPVSRICCFIVCISTCVCFYSVPQERDTAVTPDRKTYCPVWPCSFQRTMPPRFCCWAMPKRQQLRSVASTLGGAHLYIILSTFLQNSDLPHHIVTLSTLLCSLDLLHYHIFTTIQPTSIITPYPPNILIGTSGAFPSAMQSVSYPFGFGLSLDSSFMAPLTNIKASCPAGSLKRFQDNSNTSLAYDGQFAGDIFLSFNATYEQRLYRQVYECECCGTTHTQYYCPSCGSSRKV